MYLYHRNDRVIRERLIEFPDVTVQLPIYNEKHVVERIIDAVAAFDWPRNRLHIQVLDDSTDETTALVQSRIKFHQATGIDITLFHRNNRNGYKAGALQNGHNKSTSSFIAIFDADFVPMPDFLKRTIPAFTGNPKLGWVQARWDYLNEDFSILTRLLGLLSDTFFLMEQFARNRAGLPIIFNGSAGVWRRGCIDDAGGWQFDALTEDTDLSMRAQILGWQGLILPDVVVPSELPLQMVAVKQQHFRWTKGGWQTLRKAFMPLLFSKLTIRAKLSGVAKLSTCLFGPCLFILLVLGYPFTLFTNSSIKISGALLAISILGLPLEFILSHNFYQPRNWKSIFLVPLIILLEVGLSVNNTRAVIDGLFNRQNVWVRTPKFHIEIGTRNRIHSSYWLKSDISAFGEMIMAFYTIVLMIEAGSHGHYFIIPFLFVYFGGFAFVFISSWLKINNDIFILHPKQ